MRSTSSGPLRTSATRLEALPLLILVDVELREQDWPCLLDPRGLRFQRLEWLGDSVLDALLSLHVRGGSTCAPDEDYSALCSDAALGRRAAQVGLDDVLDWTPGPQRLADAVEALVGAAWLVAPDAAAVCASVLVHEGLATGPVPAQQDIRRDARLGAAVLEAASAIGLFSREDLQAVDEGELSRRRAGHIAGDRLLRQAKQRGWSVGRGAAEDRLDVVQARIGVVAASAGLEAGIDLATELLDA